MPTIVGNVLWANSHDNPKIGASHSDMLQVELRTGGTGGGRQVVVRIACNTVWTTELTTAGEEAEGAAEQGVTWRALRSCQRPRRISGNGSIRARAGTQTPIS